MIDTIIRWNGPFSLVPSDGCPEIYDAKDAKTSGIYIWALPIDGTYLINYVGITAGSVADRQAEHMRWYLSGEYKIYNPSEFALGRKVVTFDPRSGLSDFLLRYRDLSDDLIKQVQCIHVFFMPISCDKVELERIESSIIEALRVAGGRAAEFLDNLRISRWIPDEQRVAVTVHATPAFEGLPNELRA